MYADIQCSPCIFLIRTVYVSLATRRQMMQSDPVTPIPQLF